MMCKSSGMPTHINIIHDDCVFLSPVVFAPQKGKEITKLYLSAAYQVFPGDEPDEASSAGEAAEKSELGGGFHYVKHVLDGNHAVLEFETMMGDTAVNGVDIITCDDDGKIIEFKVMVRPRRAMETVHARMGAMLEQLG